MAFTYLKNRQHRIASISAVIHKYGMIYGYDTHGKVGDMLGLSRSGYHSKRKNPERWTIGELDSLMKFLHIPKQEMLDALYGAIGRP